MTYTTTSSWNEETPHDEYFDDILNCCGEDDFGRQMQQHHRDSTNNCLTDMDDNDDVNFRHRSTWNAAYRPPKLSSSFSEEYPFLSDNKMNNDNWQQMVRIRNNAAMRIQTFVRGLLERRRFHLLLHSALLVQPCIRRYIARKRYLEYRKIKKSYSPQKWKRFNVSIC